MSNKISAVINTYNAAATLEATLRSVQQFDEVVVCDMESTDDTVAIATRYGCKVVTFPKGDLHIVEPARNFAIRAAAHEWVLVLDADEVVTDELRAYLYTQVNDPYCPDGLFVPRKNFFMGRFMHATYPDYILRFMRRDKADWSPEIHSTPEIEGSVKRIPRDRKELALVHLAPNTLQDRLTKTNTYTEYELEKKKDKRYGIGALLWRPFFRFFKSYVMKQGFRDGLPGFIWAVYEGIYQFALVSKHVERKRMNQS
ncbi:MAG: glycosyltransferase family 2 protein [Bacteroidaceae bacterium]|nr:glycosyltransferase family 2 protein [Bacteroidaceae bacterium]